MEQIIRYKDVNFEIKPNQNPIEWKTNPDRTISLIDQFSNNTDDILLKIWL